MATDKIGPSSALAGNMTPAMRAALLDGSRPWASPDSETPSVRRCWQPLEAVTETLETAPTAAPEQFSARNLNLNVRELQFCSSLALARQVKHMRQEGRIVFELGTATSPFPVPPPLVESLQGNARETDYMPAGGSWELREAVADHYRRRYGLNRTAEDIQVGPGCKELTFLLMLAYYGDLVIPTPAWTSYGRQAEIAERHVHWLEASGENEWRLTAADLDAACRSDPERPRILILNYPSNITGGSYEPWELAALAEVAKRYGLIVLADEVIGQLHHQNGHDSIARFYPEGTIVSAGLGEWHGAGGWCLGTFSFPPELRWLQDAMSTVASVTYTPVSAPIQLAAICAFVHNPAIEHYLEQCRRVLAALGNLTAGRLRDAGLSVSSPVGGFCLFCDFTPIGELLRQRGIDTSFDLCTLVLEDTGVVMLPGTTFGRPADELTARLAYVDFDGARAVAGATAASNGQTLDEAFLRAYCGNTVNAVELLCRWLG